MTATKGPWKYSEELGANFSMISGDGIVVAGIPNPIRGDEEEDLEITRANARLIAASPTMLEALKRLAQVYRADWSKMSAEEKAWADKYANDSEAAALINAAIRLAEEGR